jgi:serpin B
MRYGAAIGREKPPPVEFRADHPFLFAIQHRESGVCLFLGRLNDPR